MKTFIGTKLEMDEFFKLDADSGASGDTSTGDTTVTTPPAADDTPSTTDDTTPTPSTKDSHVDIGDFNKPVAKYKSQLKKEHQDLDLSEMPTIDDLVEYYSKTKDADKNSLRIPKKGSSQEEIKAFLTKLGVPESSDKYVLDKGDLSDTQYEEAKALFQKEAYSSALSTQQAKSMWNMVKSHFSAQSKMVQQQNQQVIDSFGERFDTYLAKNENILDKEQRTTVMKENANLFKKFVDTNDFGKLFGSLGLNLNPEFITKVAKIQKQISGGGYIDSNKSFGNKEESMYSNEFMARYGKK